MFNQENPIYKKNKHNPWQDFGEETLILDPITKTSFETSQVGSDIWVKIDGKKDLKSIREEILETYDVSQDVLDTDFEAFISQLLENQLIEMVSS